MQTKHCTITKHLLQNQCGNLWHVTAGELKSCFFGLQDVGGKTQKFFFQTTSQKCERNLLCCCKKTSRLTTTHIKYALSKSTPQACNPKLRPITTQTKTRQVMISQQSKQTALVKTCKRSSCISKKSPIKPHRSKFAAHRAYIQKSRTKMSKFQTLCRFTRHSFWFSTLHLRCILASLQLSIEEYFHMS